MGKAWKNSREKTRTWRQTHIFESFCSGASEDQEQKVWATSCTINSLMGVLDAQLCLSLCNPMNCSTPGFPVLHYPMEHAQTHVHWVDDAIQPPHPLSLPLPLAFNLSQHQGLFQRVGSSNQVAKVLELQLQHQSFQWIFTFNFL